VWSGNIVEGLEEDYPHTACARGLCRSSMSCAPTAPRPAARSGAPVRPRPYSVLRQPVWPAGAGGAFFTLALVSVQARRAFPMRLEQVVRSAAEKAASKAKAASKKPKAQDAQRRLGRPKGSKNKPKADGTFMPELLRITGWLEAWLHLVAGGISLTYLVLDGHFGNHNALQMARQRTLHLISKLRCDAALSFPYTGPYAGRGPRRKYGHKINYDHLPV
jgi:putative transposase